MKLRSIVPEKMDDPALDPQEHRRALAGLRRINLLFGPSARIARSITQIASLHQCRRISVVDIGCGSGDVTRDVLRRLRGRFECSVTAFDMSSQAIAVCRKLDATSEINYRECNILTAGDELRFDFVYCSLFLHHFSDQQAIDLLIKMHRIANYAVIIDDLSRTFLGWLLANFGCHLLSRSPVVHFDGPQSVRAAFTSKEMRELAVRVGFKSVRVTHHWPERYLFVGQTR